MEGMETCICTEVVVSAPVVVEIDSSMEVVNVLVVVETCSSTGEEENVPVGEETFMNLSF